MNGPQHYRAAEQLLARVRNNQAPDTDLEALLDANAIARAQVHATLALAAATAYPAVKDWDGDEAGRSGGWAEVTKP